ncbi:MAG: AraC family transcriptional regulator [Clostridia bacterium]|nr:AraC family transcriptional regulator [Clostridia bacterium]
MLWRNQFSPGYPLISRNPIYTINAEISVVEVGYNRVMPGQKQTLLRDVYILHYIASGKGVYMDTPFDENCGYFVTPHELEVIQADRHHPYESYWIMFRGKLAGEMLKTFQLKHNCVFPFSQNKLCVKLIEDTLFHKEYTSEAEEAYELQSLFYKILAIHTTESKEIINATNSIAQNIANYIQTNYFGPIKVSDIADSFHISRNYLYTLFKREYGVSPQDYMLSFRIERAKQLLRSKYPSYSIKEISIAVGFDNPLYFSRLFKARTGRTPTEYRKEKQ